MTLLEKEAPEGGQKTSTGLPDQSKNKTVHLQIFFVLFVFAFEALLLALEWTKWRFDQKYLGFYVAAGATLPIALLWTVACINWAAAQFRWAYLWVIPNVVRLHAPSILVGVGFMVGFVLGILMWS